MPVVGAWQTDRMDISPLVAELLLLMPKNEVWEIADTSIWHTIAERWHLDFIRMLRSGDVNNLGVALAEIHRTPLLKGIDQSRDEYVRYQRSEEERARFLLEVKSLLVRLAEAFGILPVEMGPRYRAPENIYLPVAEVVGHLQAHLGISISPPAIGDGRFGLMLDSNAVLSNRDLYAVYLAARCRLIAETWRLPIERVRLLEIGGGMGRVAYYARQLGFRHITLVDLPQVSFIQAYFLRRSLGCEVHYGLGALEAKEGIRVISQSAFLDEPQESFFDLVVNSDSMPEMGWDVATTYVQAIGHRCRGLFLSANQESRKLIGDTATQAVVSEVIHSVGGFRRLYRFPFWLREQYVEELYSCGDNRQE